MDNFKHRKRCTLHNQCRGPNLDLHPEMAYSIIKLLTCLCLHIELLHQTIILVAFYTLVLPTLEYGCAVWGPFSNQNIKISQKVQNKAYRFIFKIKEQPSFKELRRGTDIQKIVFKILYLIRNRSVILCSDQARNINRKELSTDQIRNHFNVFYQIAATFILFLAASVS